MGSSQSAASIDTRCDLATRTRHRACAYRTPVNGKHARKLFILSHRPFSVVHEMGGAASPCNAAKRPRRVDITSRRCGRCAAQKRDSVVIELHAIPHDERGPHRRIPNWQGSASGYPSVTQASPRSAGSIAREMKSDTRTHGGDDKSRSVAGP